MTIDEVFGSFQIDPAKLRYYEEAGLLTCRRLTDGGRDYRGEELRRIGRIESLLKAGISPETLRDNPVLLDEDAKTGGERIRLLKRQRFRLLEDIHVKQQSLDCLDYIIRKAKDETPPRN